MKRAERKQDIINNAELKQLCKNEGIVFLALFGSFSRGENNENSDIDLFVRFSENKSLFEIIALTHKLSELLGRNVDLLTENSISSYLKETIFKEMEEIYAA
jgi:predicted nucleotidyltransferase